MPEPGQVRQPAYRQAGSLPYGEASQLNALMGLLPPEEDEDYQPSGEEESFLFSQTDRPSEPITAGLPFGEGPDFIRGPIDTDDAYMNRVAETVLVRPDVGPDLKRWAQRRLEGE